MAGTTEIKQLKCKTCGEPLDLSAAKDGVIVCGVCDSVFTLPKKEALPEVVAFLKQGEHDLDTGRFDDAHAAYSKAAELDKTEPEAYFGMALAESKVQYLKDEANNRLQPICHEISDKDFEDNPNFLKALRYATEAQRAEYERKGKEINYIKDEFYKLAQSGLDYDCFICVKVSDENGGRTQDYKTADDIYFELKGKGYKPFFSERELGGVTGADYEARILYALYSSECMLVVCFDEGYLRTKWVKNEYSRFLKLVNDEEKESDSIALVFSKKPIEKLPNRHGKIQGIAVNALSAMERIVSFVDNHTPESKRRREEAKRAREEEAKRKEKENEELRNELAELKKMFLNQQSARLAEEEAKRKAEEERARKEAEERERKEAEEKARKEREEKEQAEKAAAEAARIAEEAKRKAAEEIAKKEAAASQAAAEAKAKAKEENERMYAKAQYQKRVAERNADMLREAGKKYLDEILADIPTESKQKTAPAPAKAVPAKPTPAPAKPKSDNSAFVIKNGALTEYKGNAKYVVIPNGVTEIGDSAFALKSRIASVAMPDTVTEICDNAFLGCTGLTTINIPKGIKSIGSRAFDDCSALTNIVIPDSVTTMGSNSFIDCTGLVNVTLPNGFSDSLEKIFGKKIINSGKCRFNFTGEVKQNAFSAKAAKPTPAPVAATSDFVIENGVLKKYNGKATEVVIPNGVKEIGKSAFSVYKSPLTGVVEGCEHLASVTIPESVTKIGEFAFSGCRNVKSITLPDGLTEIGDCAFKGCGLINVTIPKNVVKFGGNPFGYCQALESITVDKNNPYFKSENNCLLSKDGKTLIAGCKNSVIPSGVLRIGAYAFYSCGISSVTLPEGLKEIGEGAFDGQGDQIYVLYNKIESIVIPLSVEKIGAKAFWCCKSDIKIYCRAASKPVGWDKDWDAHNFNLFDVDNPDKIKNVIWGYKGGIPAPKPVPAPASKPSVPKATAQPAAKPASAAKPSAVSILTKSDFVIENGILKKYTGTAKNVVVPDGVTIIGWGKAPAFTWDKSSYNTSIETITLPEGVLEIGSYAFAGCKHLESINIPSSVKKIDASAFYHCENLKRVDIKDITAWCNIDFYSMGYPNCANPLSYARHLYINGELVTDLVLPKNITKIKRYAFQKCSFTSVTIPAGVKEIGMSAFEESRLSKVVLSEGLTEIGGSVFCHCTGLKSIIIPESVTAMGAFVFYGGYVNAMNPDVTIYCRAKKQPKDWNKDWNKKNDKLIGGRHKVVWGYKGN